MIIAPIVLFVYSRPWHTQKTIEALQKNSLAIQSELFIYSDAAKNEDSIKSVNQVREYIDKIDGFKKVTVIKRDKNWGLANSIIDGVTTIINEYGKIIVLEDDIVTSPSFLNFMNKALDFYQNEEKIFSITGFSFSTEFMKFTGDSVADVYLHLRPMSWSWATWKSEWQGIDWEIHDFNEFASSRKKIRQFNLGGTDLTNMLKAQMNGQLDSWYIRWCYNAFKRQKFTIYPKISFVNNIGHDNTGVHCGDDKKNIYSHSELNIDENINFEQNIELNKAIVTRFNKGFNLTLFSRIKQPIKNILTYVKNS